MKKTNKVELDESWQRYPEARVRMREDGLKTLLEGLGPDGFCLASQPRIVFDDNEPSGVLITIQLNCGKHGSIIANGIDVFIPAKMPAPLKKKQVKEKKENEAVDEVPVPDNSSTDSDELHDNSEAAAGSIDSDDGMPES